MDPISPADRLVAILRQRLSEAQPPRQRRSSATPDRGAAVRPLRALMANGEAEERQVYRALIEELLADQLGAALSSDANFQSIVDRVLDTLIADPAGASLLRSSMRAISPG